MSERKVRQLEDKLAGVRNRELWPLSPSEQAKVAGSTARGAWREGRGHGSSTQDRHVEQTWSQAERRLSAERDALVRQAEQDERDKAEAKVKRGRK